MSLPNNRPEPGQYPAYFGNYIGLLPADEDVFDLMQVQANEVIELLTGLSEAEAEKAYAPGKWTIKELVQHMLDSERIFAYRALCIARGEKASLPGYEENDYAANSFANQRSMASMMEEYTMVRDSTIKLFRSFPEEVYDNLGTANDQPVSVRSILFVIPGHERHHINILKERYLKR